MRWEDKILKILEGTEVPYNHEHWEYLNSQLQDQELSNKIQNKFSGAEVVMPSGAWEAFESKIASTKADPFEDVVKNKFDEASMKPDMRVWENISTQISTKGKSAFELWVSKLMGSAEVAYNHKHWLAFSKMYFGSQFNWKVWSSIGALLVAFLGGAAILYNSDPNLTENSKIVEVTKANEAKSKSITVQDPMSAENGLSVRMNQDNLPQLKSDKQNLLSITSSNGKIENVSRIALKNNSNGASSHGESVLKENQELLNPDSPLSNAPLIAENQFLNQKDKILVAENNSDIQEKEMAFRQISAINKSKKIKFSNLPSQIQSLNFKGLRALGSDYQLGYLNEFSGVNGAQSIGLFNSNNIQTSVKNNWQKVFVDDQLDQFNVIYPSFFQAAYEGTSKNGVISWAGDFESQKKKYWTERKFKTQLAFSKDFGNKGLLRAGVGAKYSYSFIHDKSLSLREQAALSSNVSIGELNREQILADQRVYGEFGIGYYQKHFFTSYNVASSELWSSDLIEEYNYNHNIRAGVNFKFIPQIEQSVWYGLNRTFTNLNVHSYTLSNTFYKTVALNLSMKSNNLLNIELISKYKNIYAFAIWQTETKKEEQLFTDYSTLGGCLKGGLRWAW